MDLGPLDCRLSNLSERALDMTHQEIDTVIEQIKRDIEKGDVTALYELLKHIEHEELISFLPEPEH